MVWLNVHGAERCTRTISVAYCVCASARSRMRHAHMYNRVYRNESKDILVCILHLCIWTSHSDIHFVEICSATLIHDISSVDAYWENNRNLVFPIRVVCEFWWTPTETSSVTPLSTASKIYAHHHIHAYVYTIYVNVLYYTLSTRVVWMCIVLRESASCAPNKNRV